MPTTLSSQEFLDLAGIETRELLCSLYFPVDSAGLDQRAKRVQLKNALARLKTALSAKNWQSEKADKLLAHLDGLQNHEHFLNPSTAGLAVLVPAGRPEEMKVLALDFRPDETLTLGDHYSVAPLLRLFGSSLPRTVLALAENGLRMLKGTAHYLESVTLPEGFPKNRDEVMQFEKASGLDPKHSTQFRTGNGMSYHGEGPKETVELEFSKRYYRAIGEALTGMMSEHETILLAGVHEQLALFRKVNPELPLLHPELAGNYESQPTEVFQSKAQAILADVERAENLRAVAQTRELGSDWWTTSVGPARKAAQEGRVQTLFINVASLGEPRLEELVLEVMRHAGSVRTLDTDELETPCLARFRWSDSASSEANVPI